MLRSLHYFLLKQMIVSELITVITVIAMLPVIGVYWVILVSCLTYATLVQPGYKRTFSRGLPSLWLLMSWLRVP